MAFLKIVETDCTEQEIIKQILAALKNLNPEIERSDLSANHFVIPGTAYFLVGPYLEAFYFICGGDVKKMALLLHKVHQDEITSQDLIDLIGPEECMEEKTHALHRAQRQYEALGFSVEVLLR